MDKKEFYEKSEKIINESFEVIKKYAKILAEKTGEAAQITKLMAQKIALEHQMAKYFSKLGSRVYQQAVRQGESVSLADSEVKGILEEIKKLDTELGQVEAVLEIERKVKAEKPKACCRKKASKS